MCRAGWRNLGLVLLMLAAGPVAEAASPREKGSLLFAGGGLRFSNAEVWRRFVQLAGGKGATVVVIPAAASNPSASGRAVVENLICYGAKAELVPIAPRLKDVDYRAAARDPALVRLLRKATGIWFTGGDQQRITRALLPDGRRTPALEAIWEAYRGGAVVGGSSAGTAIMSRVMFADAQNSLDTIKNGITRGKHVAAGLGFIGDDWFVDQHFLARGRFARALLAMREYGFEYGIGVDVDTAVVVKDGNFEVIGYNGALVLDLSGATYDRELPAFNLKNARLSYLDSGDRMDMKTRKVTVSRLKASEPMIDPRAKDFVPEFTSAGHFYFSDILSTNAIYRAMRNALAGKTGVVKGLAFAQPEGGAKNDLGFEFKVYRGPGTVGWYTARGGHEAYTVLEVRVDITPVKLPNPLYTPLKH